MSGVMAGQSDPAPSGANPIEGQSDPQTSASETLAGEGTLNSAIVIYQTEESAKASVGAFRMVFKQ